MHEKYHENLQKKKWKFRAKYIHIIFLVQRDKICASSKKQRNISELIAWTNYSSHYKMLSSLEIKEIASALPIHARVINGWMIERTNEERNILRLQIILQ